MNNGLADIIYAPGASRGPKLRKSDLKFAIIIAKSYFGLENDSSDSQTNTHTVYPQIYPPNRNHLVKISFKKLNKLEFKLNRAKDYQKTN